MKQVTTQKMPMMQVEIHHMLIEFHLKRIYLLNNIIQMKSKGKWMISNRIILKWKIKKM